MAIVEVDGEDYTAYADIDTADLYLAAATHAATWQASTDDDAKGRALVTATRILDRQVWATKYNTVALREVEENIINASIEMASALMDGAEFQTQQNTAERFHSLTAGSVSITNFRGIDNPTRFPQIVQELLRGYLGGTFGASGAKVTGVDTETSFPTDPNFGFSIGGL